MLEACSQVSDPLRMQAIICLLWIFGKRIGEVLSLRLKDVYIRGRAQDKYLHVAFTVQKKANKYETMQPKPYVKKITSQNHFVKPILQYYLRRNKEAIALIEAGKAKDIDNQWLFTSHTGREDRTKTVTVKHRFREEQGKLVLDDKNGTVVKTYNYTKACGHISYWRVRQELRKVTQAWTHLFRTSLCSQFAEEGCNEEDLCHWFDWSRIETAHTYVRHSSSYSSKFSKRRF
jgi:integrase